MKKLLVLLLPVLVSCALDDTTITNNSSETVEVVFRHTGSLTIPARQTISVETRYRMPIESYTPEEWVKIDHHSLYLIVFDDRGRLPIRVRNFSNTAAYFTVRGRTRPVNIEDLPVAAGAEIPVGYIYDASPRFEAFSASNGERFPMLVMYSSDGPVFLVSIH